MTDPILDGIDEGVILPPAPTTTSEPLTWTAIAALIETLPMAVRDRPAVLYVPERVPTVTAYVLTTITPLGVAQTDILPI